MWLKKALVDYFFNKLVTLLQALAMVLASCTTSVAFLLLQLALKDELLYPML